MSGEVISVAIVDDHPIVRAGLRSVLGLAEDVRVIAEGVNGESALRLVAEFEPTVLVLDVNLPDLNGIEVTRRLAGQKFRTRILILTVNEEPETIFGLLEAGAVGYILKEDALETLAIAIRAVAQGKNWLSPIIAGQVMRRSLGEVDHAPDPVRLTPREIDVLRLLGAGLDNAAIAGRLTLTRRTVQNHVCTIYQKLGVKTRPEAVIYALRHKIASVAPLQDGIEIHGHGTA